MLPVLLLLTLGKPPLVSGDLAQTAATCTSAYAWMGTSKGVSPCQVAASLNALCNNGNWNLPALDASVHYSNPSTTDGTATLCTCSWASYNLISACTACQGYEEQIAFWSAYTADCTGKTSDTYWPTKITISTDIAIPYWASIDPTKWTNEKFNPPEAKNWTSYADLTPASPSPSSSSQSASTPVGAIVGAVVGSLVVLVAFAVIVIWIIRRHHKRLASGHVVANADSRLPHHRKISDTTVDSGLGSLTSGTPLVQQSTSGATRMNNNNSSASSLPFFQSLGRAIVTPSRQESRSPPRPEEFITPYMLPPTNESPDKKQSNGEWPVFDPPNAPPQNSVRMAVIPSQTPPRRARYNPPAYSEADPTSPTSPTSRHHAQESLDSNLSTPDTSSQGSTIQMRPTHTPANSGSSMGHMAISSPLRTSMGTMHTSVSTVHTSIGAFSSQQGHGRSLASRRSGSRELRRQTQDSINPSDIA